MWSKVTQKGTQPKPRSGHTLTFVDRAQYIVYGGIEDASTGNKIAPTGDIYSMKLHLSKYRLYYLRAVAVLKISVSHLLFFESERCGDLNKFWNVQLMNFNRGVPLGKRKRTRWWDPPCQSTTHCPGYTQVWPCLHLRWSFKPNLKTQWLLVA